MTVNHETNRKWSLFQQQLSMKMGHSAYHKNNVACDSYRKCSHSLTVSSYARQLASGLCKHCENSPCTSTRGCLASLMALTETHRLQLHKGKPTTACLPSADLAFEEMFLRANSRNLFVCNRLKALRFPRGYYNNNNVSLAVLYMLFYQFVLLPFILNVIPLLEIPDMNF